MNKTEFIKLAQNGTIIRSLNMENIEISTDNLITRNIENFYNFLMKNYNIDILDLIQITLYNFFEIDKKHRKLINKLKRYVLKEIQKEIQQENLKGVR